MALGKHYTPVTWKDKPSTDTAINAYRLNHLENGVNENDNRIVGLDADKLDKTTANKMVSAVALDTDTGILTVTLLDGTQMTYDLDIEKVVANFDLDENNDLVLTLADGTQKKVPLSKFVDTYTFNNSATITFNTNGKTITAVIPDGAVTLSKLEATVVSTIRQYTLDAQTAKGQAEQAAKTAQGWAVGGEGFENSNAQYFANQAKRYAVTTDEAPEDNAQYYCQKAQEAAEKAAGATGFDGTATTVKATDTQGLAGEAGGESTMQALIDAVAQKVVNELVTNAALTEALASYVTKAMIVNNALTTKAGVGVLDAAMGKTLGDAVAQLNGNKLDADKVIVGDSYLKILSGAYNTFAIPSSYGLWWKVLEFGIRVEYVQLGISYTSEAATMIIRNYHEGAYTEWMKL